MKCRTIEDTTTVKIEDAEFTIGLVPRGIWLPIKAAQTKNRMELGKEALAVASKEAADLNQEDINTFLKEIPFDRLETLEIGLQTSMRKAVKYAVKAHKNITDSSGKEIPAKTAIEDGRTVLDDETVELYAINGILVKLGTEVFAFQELSEEDRKN